MAKSKSPTPETASDTAKPSGVSKKVRLIGTAVLGLVVMSAGGTYFAMSGAEASEVAGAAPALSEIPVPMPVAPVASAVPVQADDYKIVSIFGDEAILMTGTNLVRVKVGSTAPGLGVITAVEATPDGGGSVVATQATLRAL